MVGESACIPHKDIWSPRCVRVCVCVRIGYIHKGSCLIVCDAFQTDRIMCVVSVCYICFEISWKKNARRRCRKLQCVPFDHRDISAKGIFTLQERAITKPRSLELAKSLAESILIGHFAWEDADYVYYIPMGVRKWDILDVAT